MKLAVLSYYLCLGTECSSAHGIRRFLLSTLTLPNTIDSEYEEHVSAIQREERVRENEGEHFRAVSWRRGRDWTQIRRQKNRVCLFTLSALARQCGNSCLEKEALFGVRSRHFYTSTESNYSIISDF
jgi:hypothetical protein